MNIEELLPGEATPSYTCWPATVIGVTELLEALAGPVPLALVAVTVKV